ncbi:hypothetical protein [Fortiea contorta]|uniref:hypothetical protein n=1 Tax=Fortiea contorta TaxID=1892405 RepID=UPI000347CEED|nr:hypothetical protein [Fortiea contorta]
MFTNKNTTVIPKIIGFYNVIKLLRFKNYGLRLDSPDRLILENTIIPYFISENKLSRVLFVGCGWYTKSYSSLFKNQEYWTIEIDPNKKIYGSKNHIIDGLQNLGKYIENDFFDLIIYNGVFGWGINSREDTEESFKQCFNCLRQGGILVFGWNDVPEHKPFPVLQECQALKKFAPYFFPPLQTTEYLTPATMSHTFNFYIKPFA